MYLTSSSTSGPRLENGNPSCLDICSSRKRTFREDGDDFETFFDRNSLSAIEVTFFVESEILLSFFSFFFFVAFRVFSFFFLGREIFVSERRR